MKRFSLTRGLEVNLLLSTHRSSVISAMVPSLVAMDTNNTMERPLFSSLWVTLVPHHTTQRHAVQYSSVFIEERWTRCLTSSACSPPVQLFTPLSSLTHWPNQGLNPSPLWSRLLHTCSLALQNSTWHCVASYIRCLAVAKTAPYPITLS